MVLGFHFVGPNAAEVTQGFALVCEACDRVKLQLVHAYDGVPVLGANVLSVLVCFVFPRQSPKEQQNRILMTLLRFIQRMPKHFAVWRCERV